MLIMEGKEVAMETKEKEEKKKNLDFVISGSALIP